MDNKFMIEAFKCAEESLKCGEIPVGAVIVKENKIISTGYNKKEMNNCVLDHAELIAIREASEFLGNWRLNDCDIYVTLEPCEMCAAAIKQARIKNIYSALANDDIFIHKRVLEILKTDKSNPQVNMYNDLYKEESSKLLKEFFISTRKK